MRKLKTTDVFVALRTIKAANLREEIKPVLERAASGTLSVQQVGIDGFLSLMDLLSEKKCERQLYEFLAGPFETTADKIAAMDLDELARGLATIAEENDLKTFFGYVSGILGKKSST